MPGLLARRMACLDVFLAAVAFSSAATRIWSKSFFGLGFEAAQSAP